MAVEALHGGNLIDGCVSRAGDDEFRSVEPASGARLEPGFAEATDQEIAAAAAAAERAFASCRRATDVARAEFLLAIATQLENAREPIVSRALRETSRAVDGLHAELSRTIRICESFARLIRTDHWRNPRIDEARDGPVPLPEMRRTSVPLGPVLVYGASNIPLMGSACGTDVIAALAAGCPVVVKGHPAHPGTSELIATAVLSAIGLSPDIPYGAYTLIQSRSPQTSVALARTEGIRAIAFTGSLGAGRAIFDAAGSRLNPIPVFAEMGSVNPLFVLPGGACRDPDRLAASIATAVTRNVGQLCTKPGIVALPADATGDRIVSQTVEAIADVPAAPLLHDGVKRAFVERLAQVSGLPDVKVVLDGDHDGSTTLASGVVLRCSAETYLAHEDARSEIFGPATTFVTYDDTSQLRAIAEQLSGELTATLWGETSELSEYDGLVGLLSTKAGRVLWNSMPTGTPDCEAMHHGGPYPAATNPQHTSIGPTTLTKFLRPVVFQNFPVPHLPAELQ